MDIDMKQEYLISGFTYFPAPPAGFIESYVVQVSRDGEKWETVHRDNASLNVLRKKRSENKYRDFFLHQYSKDFIERDLIFIVH